MRRFFLCFLFGMSCLLPLSAQASIPDTALFGNVVCQKNVVCPSFDSDIASYVALANLCVQQTFAYKSTDLFSSSLPDSDGCLTTVGSELFGSSTNPLQPVCCYEPEDNTGTSCRLHCVSVSAKQTIAP